jgi:hypothetical protein
MLVATGELPTILARITRNGGTIAQRLFITEIGDRQVSIVDIPSGRERTVAVDAVVLATTRLPQGEALAGELDGKIEQVYSIGDAAAPRGLPEATFEGQKFARMIGDPTAPRNFAEAYFESRRPEETPRPAGAVSQ